MIKDNPNNHIAKEILVKLAQNCPNLSDIKLEFAQEYECVWIGDKDGK